MPDSIRQHESFSTHPSDASASPCFGLRIEGHLLQVAVATPIPGNGYQLAIDEIACDDPNGWLNTDGSQLLIDALETMAERHQMRRRSIAVSLDGDFCVTRVTIGTSDEVDHELGMLANRVPRYLQLGPGEKVTGGARRKIEPNVDYAVTGVVNRSMIQLIYDALRSVDIEVTWVEPSLVGVARLVGQPSLWGDQPIMIADGTGKHWDVGIACSGRLLLDYRPANANSEVSLRDSLVGHISRLKRFCHRRLRGVSSELNELLLCGDGDKPAKAIEVMGDMKQLQPSILEVPLLPHIYQIEEKYRRPHYVSAVATVFPLLIGISSHDVPDLLVQVRRAPDLSWGKQFWMQCWPAIAATLVLMISYGLVGSERRRHAGTNTARTSLQTKIVASNIKFSKLARRREMLNHFRQIEQQTWEPNWDEMLSDITQSLPSSSKLNEFRVEDDGMLLMDGIVLDESVVYELVNTLRRLPSVTQVALKGTAPEQDGQATRFTIKLTTKRIASEVSTGAGDE